MAKKIILALIILILIAFIFLFSMSDNSVDIFIDGENITVKTNTVSNINQDALCQEICDYTLKAMNDTDLDINSYKSEVSNICVRYGLENPEINLDSSIGPNQIPVMIHVEGTSMLPTLQDGQKVLINKTHNVHVGDIVVAESDEYGGIIKRVDKIDENSIHLVSDNKEISYEVINGGIYEIRGITTWVDISDINGVAIQY